MKFLLDENLSRRLVSRLADAYPGTTHVETAKLSGQTDSAIWNYAAKEGFVIVSKDDDFRQLSFFRGHPPKVIWLTVGNAGTNSIAELLLQKRELIAAFVDQPEDTLLTLSLNDIDLSLEEATVE